MYIIMDMYIEAYTYKVLFKPTFLPNCQMGTFALNSRKNFQKHSFEKEVYKIHSNTGK
jgi:hypothetical protein